MEKIGGGITDGVMKGISLLGAKKTARRVASIQAPVLARGLVLAGLESNFEGKVLHSDTLRELGWSFDEAPNRELARASGE